MTNLFDVDTNEGVPTVLTNGVTWVWQEAELSADYPPSLYSISYQFTNLDTLQNYQIDAVDVSGIHTVTVADTVTAAYNDGRTDYTTKITRLSDSQSVALPGQIIKVLSLIPSQSYNYTVLKAIRATIAKTATKEQLQYSVSGMQLSRRSTDQLVRLEKEFSRRVANEERQRKADAGERINNGNVKIIMGA